MCPIIFIVFFLQLKCLLIKILFTGVITVVEISTAKVAIIPSMKRHLKSHPSEFEKFEFAEKEENKQATSRPRLQSAPPLLSQPTI